MRIVTSNNIKKHPRATPTPMPAFAPVDSPPVGCSSEGLAVFAGPVCDGVDAAAADLVDGVLVCGVVEVVAAAAPEGRRGADAGLNLSKSLEAHATVIAQSYARKGVVTVVVEVSSICTAFGPVLAFLHFPMMDVPASKPLHIWC